MKAGAPASARAAALARKPTRSAIARMRARVCSETPGRSFSAYETAPLETPASRAMSAIVGLFTRRPLRQVTEAAGGHHRLHPAVRAQLAHRVTQIALHRLRQQAEPAARLGVAAADRHHR